MNNKPPAKGLASFGPAGQDNPTLYSYYYIYKYMYIWMIYHGLSAKRVLGVSQEPSNRSLL